MDLKPSLCIKNTNINKYVIENNDLNQYNNIDLKINKELSNKDIDLLIESIEKLDEEDHNKIYVIIRNSGIDSEYFSTSNKGVYFDFYKLSNELKLQIFNFVILSINNNTRKNDINNLNILNDKNYKLFKEKIELLTIKNKNT